MKLVTLADVADILRLSPTSFRIFFNVLAPNIQRHKLPGQKHGYKRVMYSYADMCALMRSVMPRWNAIHEEKLYQKIQEREHV